jgi:hypothetical protein
MIMREAVDHIASNWSYLSPDEAARLRQAIEAHTRINKSGHMDGLMFRISEYLEQCAGPASIRVIRSKVSGRNTDIALALQGLIQAGYVRLTFGPRRVREHTLIKSYCAASRR